MLHFIFPSGSRHDVPDEMFAEQMGALRATGFSTSLCPEAVFAGTTSLRDIPPGSEVVYRGWMVKSDEYVAMVNAIEQSGARAFTSLKQYLAAHHLPNWYPLISELTPETRVYPEETDFIAELNSLDWDAYFLKDYVKSLKTARGSVVRNPAEVAAVIVEMKEYRGEIEGGICVRRVEDFVPESEQRYFVLFGVSYEASDRSPIPDIVRQCAERVSSNFFSVDVVRRRDGALRVVEIGDGQVSDLVGWTAAAFASMWEQRFNVREPT